jgi:ADP-ribose pyrophosphatase
MSIKRKKIYNGKIIKLYKDTINIKNKKLIREIISHPGSVVLIPVLNIKTKEIVLIKQFRYAISKYILELPAGTLEKNETPLSCAKRELEEETGFRAKNLKKITSFYPSPGIMTEKMHLFLATDLIQKAPKPDMDEKIKIVKIKLDKALKMIYKKKIKDAKTIAGILMFNFLFKNK